MEQIYKYLICAFFGLITFILDDPSHDYPVFFRFSNNCKVLFYSVSSTFRFEAYAYVLVRR